MQSIASPDSVAGADVVGETSELLTVIQRFYQRLTVSQRYSRNGVLALLNSMFQSNTLAKVLNHEDLRDGLALGVRSAAHTAL